MLRSILPRIFLPRSLAHVYAAWKEKRYYDLYQQMRGDVELNVVLNMEILLHLINRLLLEQAWH